MPKNARERFDVAVVSRDPAALVAAWACARIGLRVIVLELPDAELGDAPSNAGGTVAQLCSDLGLAITIQEPPRGEENIYGIPGNPFSTSVRGALGWRGAWRICMGWAACTATSKAATYWYLRPCASRWRTLARLPS